MDINLMMPEQHAECMQKGLCFGCRKQGHLGRDCPDTNQASTLKQPQRPQTQMPKRYNRKELHHHI